MIKKEKKEEIINELAEKLAKCSVAIATDYRGITAKEMVQLRRQLHNQGIQYRVVKNTLVRFAAEKSGIKGMDRFLTGPMAIAVGYDDPVKVAKTLADHIKTNNSVLKIKGGVLGSRILSADDVINLAETPSKEVLLGKLLASLKMPITSLHYVLSAPLRGLTGALNARIRQLESASQF